MRFLFLLVIFAIHLNADTIGNVEYHLPQIEQGWGTAHSQSQGQNTFVCYVPAMASLANPSKIFEMFAVLKNNKNLEFSLGDMNQNELKEAIIESLAINFPGQKIDVKVLKADSQSTIYEYTILMENTEIHSLARVFDTSPGNVALLYQVDNRDVFLQHRHAVIQTLENAVEK